MFCAGLPEYATPRAGCSVVEYQEYIERLPLEDPPQLCGMSPHADTANAVRQARRLLLQLRTAMAAADPRSRVGDSTALTMTLKRYLQVECRSRGDVR